MSAPAMRLDFAASGRRRGRAPLVLLVIGVLCMAGVVLAYQKDRERADGLELRLAALSGDGEAVRDVAGASGKSLEELRAAVAELATPWGRLLAELESAAGESRQSVAVLEIEPDREGRQVRIVAESRSLAAAVAFAERLQQSEVLQYPLLDSHEVQVKDPYRPVRFQVTASWRMGS